MIQSLYVENFGPIGQAIEAKLSPIHAFIGPNDSGKTMLLRALKTLGRLFTVSPPSTDDLRLLGRKSGTTRLGVELGGARLVVETTVQLQTRVALSREPHLPWRSIVSDYSPQASGMALSPFLPIAERALVEGAFIGLRWVHLQATALRQPSQLMTTPDLESFFASDGLGLPGLYDWILNRNVKAFEQINQQMREFFPTIKNIRLENLESQQKAFVIELNDGAEVRPEAQSEGVLYFLAFAALPYIAPSPLLLVEEPENGLHPARIADIMKVLRALSEKGTQVVIATHSPLVINELNPNEVSVVTRESEGSKVTPMTETAHFRTREKVYALGELWLNYADGNKEAPLLKGLAGP